MQKFFAFDLHITWPVSIFPDLMAIISSFNTCFTSGVANGSHGATSDAEMADLDGEGVPGVSDKATRVTNSASYWPHGPGGPCHPLASRS